MILNVSVEFAKYDKSEIKPELRSDFINFLEKSRVKMQEVAETKNIEFNQAEFFLTFKGKNEALDKFIDFLLQEIETYNIENKSEEEIKEIASKYCNSLKQADRLITNRVLVTIHTLFGFGIRSKDAIKIKKYLEDLPENNI
jgi:nicotinic acid phosphoribosyltransferase